MLEVRVTTSMCSEFFGIHAIVVTVTSAAAVSHAGTETDTHCATKMETNISTQIKSRSARERERERGEGRYNEEKYQRRRGLAEWSAGNPSSSRPRFSLPPRHNNHSDHTYGTVPVPSEEAEKMTLLSEPNRTSFTYDACPRKIFSVFPDFRP